MIYMTVSIAGEDPFFDALCKFQRHITGCYDCKGGMKSLDDSRMCIKGVILAAEMGKNMLQLMKLKRQAVQSSAAIVYPCPDLSRHGNGYATIARPMKVVGYQGELF